MSLVSSLRFWKSRSKLASSGRIHRRKPRRNFACRNVRLERLEERTVLSAVAPGAEQVPAAYGQIPLSFEANQGQTAAEVNFLSRGNGYALFLTPTEAVLSLHRSGSGPSQNAVSVPTDVLSMQLIGGNPVATATGLDQQAGTSNYLIGDNPNQWQTNIANYGKVEYDGVYPGVNLVYYGNQQQLEYDFVVAPGSNPGAIKLGFQGAGSVTLDAQGDLVLHTSGGDVVEHAPAVYQQTAGGRQAVSGNFVLEGNDRVGFQVGAYDTSEPLVIDPVLSYSTYLGGSGGDAGSGIAVDASGDAYVTGSTGSANFPTTSGALSGNLAGTEDAFVTKLNASGTAIVYSTYLGGSGYDNAYGIAVDASGDAYVTGLTQSANFPTTGGAFQSQFLGSQDAFVTKLNATGTALVYSTLLGGSTGGDYGTGIAVDVSGDAYVAGVTGSANFPTTANAFQRTSYSGFYSGAFVSEINTSNSGSKSLIYSTYLGGTSGDPGYSTTLDTEAQGIALDSSGNVYVTGETASDTFATTAGAFQTTNPKYPYGVNTVAYSAFVTKINPSDSGSASLAYSTYLAGTYDESGDGIAVDASGDAYVTGWTMSSDFPTTAGALQPALAAAANNDNAFVTELNATGSALVYSTFLGGTGNDFGNGIAVDASGEAYVTGSTQSTNFPTANPLQSTYGGGQDAFVAKLNAAGSSLVYSTYLGGSGGDMGSGIALDSAGNAYVTGTTGSTNFPTSNPLQSANGGSDDAFVAKISQSAGFTLSSPANVTAGGTFNVTVEATDASGNLNAGYTGTVDFTSSDGQAVLPANYTFTATDAGIHTFSVTLKSSGNQTVTATDTVTGSITGASNTISVAAAAAIRFTLSAPASAAAGSSLNVIVTAKDAYGNTATGYTGTTHFTSSDSSAVLPANYTLGSSDAGTHTFSVTLKKSGRQNVTATDTVTGSITGASGTISVAAAAASKFVFISAPASVKAGTAFSLTIAVTDAYGNVVTNYTGTVKFTDSVGSATLPSNYTFTASDKGVHIFTGVVLNKKATQTIAVTDTKHSSIAGSTNVAVS